MGQHNVVRIIKERVRLCIGATLCGEDNQEAGETDRNGFDSQVSSVEMDQTIPKSLQLKWIKRFPSLFS